MGAIPILPVIFAIRWLRKRSNHIYQILDEYYIETKYPTSAPIDYSKKEAQKAIDLAPEILDFVEKRIKRT